MFTNGDSSCLEKNLSFTEKCPVQPLCLISLNQHTSWAASEVDSEADSFICRKKRRKPEIVSYGRAVYRSSRSDNL